MADPFSVAGSAVGVLSLAITTCQGVLSYYNSWDSQDQNISDAKRKIERLRSSLSALEEVLPKLSSSPVIAANVEQSVLCCKEGTVRLEHFLEKCRKNPAPLSLIDKIHDFRKKAIFPFRQSSLDSLREIVRDLEDSLGTALQVLQIDTSEAQFRRTLDLTDLRKSTAISVEGASEGISNVEQKVDRVMGALPQIQQDVVRFTSDIPMLRSSLTRMEQNIQERLQAIEMFTSQISPEFQTKIDQLPLRIRECLAEPTALAGLRPSVETSGLNVINSAMSTTLTTMDEDARKLQLVLAQRPSLLRTVCDGAGGLEMNIECTSTMAAQNRITKDRRNRKRTKQSSWCSCSTLRQERATTYSISGIEFFKRSTESCKHSVACPFYIGTEAATTVGLKMTYYVRLLANTVRASMSITAGAGGFSINPCLNFRAVVPRDSPAFSLLGSSRLHERFPSTSSYETNEICEYFESALRELYELFRSKAASPNDVDEDGTTLLIKICECVWYVYGLDAEVFHSFRILFMGLVAAGVPLNETSNDDRSALNQLTEIALGGNGFSRHVQDFTELCLDVSEAGAELSESWYRVYLSSSKSRIRELELAAKYDTWIEDSNYGALSAAIFCRSAHDAERILQCFPQSIYEQNFRGQSPLHLSYNWPKGISLLLRHGGSEILSRSDNRGDLPLAYSCSSNCLEAVKLMLEADSPLYVPDHHDDGVFEEAIQTSSDEIISHLQTALVDRRSRLYSLAITMLCRKDLDELEIPGDHILDEKASDVYAALKHRNVPIPSALRTPRRRRTLFHSTDLSPALRESLHGCGFLDVDGINFCGLTPLMTMGDPSIRTIDASLQRASWLISKGADPGRKPEMCGPMRFMPWDPSITAAHGLCSWVGRAVYQCMPSWIPYEINDVTLFGLLEDLEENSKSLLGEMLSLKIYDACLCACSSHGCTPATMVLKGIKAVLQGYWIKKPPGEGRLWVIEWVERLLNDRYEVWQWLSGEIIRYETFEALGLTHTCCKIDVWDTMPTLNDSVDCEEIRDEERLLISKLDALVEEFQEKHTELGVSVSDFLKGYWKTRMEEIEREEEPLDDEDIAKIRDVGVVIHS